MKNLLLFIFMTCCITVNAQFDFYTHNFNDNRLEGWTIVDYDGNGTTWALENNQENIWYPEKIETKFDVLSLRSFELSRPNGNTPKSNWAILPAQDLSFYGGNKLNFSYLKGNSGVDRNTKLNIYASTTPNVTDMLTNGPITTVILEGDFSEPNNTVIKTVEIPAVWNLPTVYFAIEYTIAKTNPNTFISNIELIEVSLSANEFLSTEDFLKPTPSVLKQNPVEDNFQVAIANNFSPESINITIYNTAGLQVKQAMYHEAGINVSDLANGIYIAVLKNGSTTESIKFIKK